MTLQALSETLILPLICAVMRYLSSWHHNGDGHPAPESGTLTRILTVPTALPVTR